MTLLPAPQVPQLHDLPGLRQLAVGGPRLRKLAALLELVAAAVGSPGIVEGCTHASGRIQARRQLLLLTADQHLQNDVLAARSRHADDDAIAEGEVAALTRGGPSMLIATQVVRSKSELVKEVQTLSVTTAVIYRNVDRRAWEAIAREHQGARVIVVVQLPFRGLVPVVVWLPLPSP